ncbi:MAG: hypothetical protein M1482_08540 [Chloroflexi bacterium]|nr:hypothetical protein [Chloroflexota bacterium]
MDNIEKKPLGVIDALASGFELVARRPWVLLVPVGFNLFLWLGPQVNAKPIFDQALGLLNAAAAYSPTLSPEATQGYAVSRDMLQTMGQEFNVLNFIAVFALGVPALVGLGAGPVKPWFVIGDLGSLTIALVASAFIGIFVASVYLEIIARAVRRDGQPRSFAPRVLKSYLSTGLFVGLALVCIVVLVSPFMIGAALVSVLSQGLASFIVILGIMLVLWAILYLAFALPAVFVSGSNPVQAAWNSVTVFRYNSWSAMGLVFLIFLIQSGFSLIWQQLPRGTLVDTFNVLANAFLGSGLVAAAMLFYHDRFTWLTEVRERIRRQQRPLIKG